MLLSPSDSYFRDNPLNELARNSPSDVMSRYSTSATKVSSTHVALGFLMGLVSLDYVSLCTLDQNGRITSTCVPAG